MPRITTRITQTGRSLSQRSCALMFTTVITAYVGLAALSLLVSVYGGPAVFLAATAAACAAIVIWGTTLSVTAVRLSSRISQHALATKNLQPRQISH